VPVEELKILLLNTNLKDSLHLKFGFTLESAGEFENIPIPLVHLMDCY
jgi:hypothetical protein